MGTVTRKIRKKSDNDLKGRRGHHTQTKKMADIKIPDASPKKRLTAFIIDVIVMIIFSEFLFFRNAPAILLDNPNGAIGRLLVYAVSFILLYTFPLRAFGQSIGMKLMKIRLLLREDLSFVPMSAIMQRQSVGLVLNATVGLVPYISKKNVLSDEIFKTKVIEIEKTK